MLGEEQILWDVVEEHLDEAEFLVEQWRQARVSPDYTLRELGEGPERRLGAHVDALVVNGPLALQRVAWPAIEQDESDRLTAAALALLDGGDFRVFDRLVELSDGQLDSAEDDEPDTPALASAFALALSLCTHPGIEREILAHLPKARGGGLGVLLRACAHRGLDPGPAVVAAFGDAEPGVVEAALRAAAFGDRRHLLAYAEAYLQHPSSRVRSAAMDTGLGWGSHQAWALAMHEFRRPGGRSAMVWMACLGDDRHAEALVGLLGEQMLVADALWALGFSGRLPAIEACVERLDHEDELVRRLAGEALVHILGLDPEDDALWEQPQLDEPGLQGDDPDDDDDELDADLQPRAEDELPLPNAAAIRSLWEQVRGGFTAGYRYLRGKPVEHEGPGWILTGLSCRRIDVVAREVVARSSGRGRWPSGVRARIQQQAVSALAALGREPGAQRDWAR